MESDSDSTNFLECQYCCRMMDFVNNTNLSRRRSALADKLNKVIQSIHSVKFDQCTCYCRPLPKPKKHYSEDSFLLYEYYRKQWENDKFLNRPSTKISYELLRLSKQ